MQTKPQAKEGETELTKKDDDEPKFLDDDFDTPRIKRPWPWKDGVGFLVAGIQVLGVMISAMVVITILHWIFSFGGSCD